VAARRGSAWSQSRSSGRSVVSPVGEMNGVHGLAAGAFPLPPSPGLRRTGPPTPGLGRDRSARRVGGKGTLVLSPKEKRGKSQR